VSPTIGWFSNPNAANSDEQRRPEHTVADAVQPQWQVTVVNHARDAVMPNEKAQRRPGGAAVAENECLNSGDAGAEDP
jgi:hypothetical protein